MAVTLSCAGCEKRETHDHRWQWVGWFILTDHADMLNEWHLCSFYCLGLWALREEGFRRHAKQQQPLEAGGRGLSEGRP